MKIDARPRIRPMVTVVALGLLAGPGCSALDSGGAAATPNRVPNPLSLTDPSQLPDPCGLLSPAEVAPLIGDVGAGVSTVGTVRPDDPLLFRTCTWGDSASATGAIGIQIGTSNDSGHDVVLNRSSAMDPAVDYAAVPDGKETMNVGIMPTGGARGATVYFETGGYSVLVAQIGAGTQPGDVEDLGEIVYRALGGT